jgi:hypothetical protein
MKRKNIQYDEKKDEKNKKNKKVKIIKRKKIINIYEIYKNALQEHLYFSLNNIIYRYIFNHNVIIKKISCNKLFKHDKLKAYSDDNNDDDDIDYYDTDCLEISASEDEIYVNSSPIIDYSVDCDFTTIYSPVSHNLFYIPKYVFFADSSIGQEIKFNIDNSVISKRIFIKKNSSIHQKNMNELFKKSNNNSNKQMYYSDKCNLFSGINLYDKYKNITRNNYENPVITSDIKYINQILIIIDNNSQELKSDKDLELYLINPFKIKFEICNKVNSIIKKIKKKNITTTYILYFYNILVTDTSNNNNNFLLLKEDDMYYFKETLNQMENLNGFGEF